MFVAPNEFLLRSAVFRFVRDLLMYRLSDEELAALSAYVLFSPNRAGLKRTAAIQVLHDRMRAALCYAFRKRVTAAADAELKNGDKSQASSVSGEHYATDVELYTSQFLERLSVQMSEIGTLYRSCVVDLLHSFPTISAQLPPLFYEMYCT